MRAIYKKRLLKLADFLDKLPVEKFDYSIIAKEAGLPMKEALAKGPVSCGSVACAIGWMPAVFPRSIKWEKASMVDKTLYVVDKAGRLNFNAAAEWFGIELFSTARKLFDPACNRLGLNATPQAVAAHIRRFVSNA